MAELDKALESVTDNASVQYLRNWHIVRKLIDLCSEKGGKWKEQESNILTSLSNDASTFQIISLDLLIVEALVLLGLLSFPLYVFRGDPPPPSIIWFYVLMCNRNEVFQTADK